MKHFKKRLLSIVLTLIMVITLVPSVVFADQTIENSPYQSFAAMGDSISMGYGPMMGDNSWNKYFYSETPDGSYPALLRDDLGLDGMNSLMCVRQRLTDLYYALGCEPGEVRNYYGSDVLTGEEGEDAEIPEYISYLEDAYRFQDSGIMAAVEEMHAGEGARRVEDSDLVTIMMGMADIMLYPSKFINEESDTEFILQMIQDGVNQFDTYYPKVLSRIKEINPNAKIAILSMYDPFARFEATGTKDKATIAAFREAVKLMNAKLKLWSALYGCTYVDISDLGLYVDRDTIVVEEGQLMSAMGKHENHAGAAGQQYMENQILAALGLERGSVTPSTDDTTSYLAFTSDTHVTDSGESVTRLENWIYNISDQLGDITFDSMGICGDIASASLGGEAYTHKVQYLMNSVDQNTKVARGIYTTGNHEYSPGKYATLSEYEPYSNYIRLGEAANTDKYQIYCFGAAQYSYKFNDDDVAALAAYLESADSSKPVFIMSHFPIHSIGDHVTTNTEGLVELLNNYPNVVFLWGHSHTEADPHYGKVYTGDLDGMAINFVYCSAGCMSDSEYSSGSAKTTAKGLVASVDGDSDYQLTYYDKNYQVLASYTVNVNTGDAEQTGPDMEPQDDNFDGNIYNKVSSLSSGEYVLTVDNIAMNNVEHTGYTCVNNNINYEYTGLGGARVTVQSDKLTAGLVENEIWTVKAVSGGFTLQSADGKYLTGYYYQDAGAAVKLEDEYSANAVWSYSNSHIKNTATGKYLNYESDGDVSGTQTGGELNVFTLRSSANDTISFYSVGSAEEETVVTGYSVARNLTAGAWYVITAENKALINTPHAGYTNTNNGSKYSYSGLSGVPVSASGSYLTGNVTNQMLWQAVEASGGMALRNKDGKYLNASYVKNQDGFTGIGKLYLSDEPQVWVLSGNALKEASSGKYLNYQSSSDIDGTKNSGSSDFFTIRSSSKDQVIVYQAANGDGGSADENEVLDTSFVRSEGETITTYNLVGASGTLADGDEIILSRSKAFLTNAKYEDAQINNDNYYYTGLKTVATSDDVGSAAKVLSPMTEEELKDIVWTVKTTEGGYYLTNNGKYLSGSYATDVEVESTVVKGYGDLYLLDTPDETSVWTITTGTDYHTTLKNNQGKCIVPQTGFFTVRSSGYAYMYKKSEMKVSAIVDNKAHILVSENGYALSSTQGQGYNDDSSNYRYEGRKAAYVTVEDNKIASAVTNDLLWYFEKQENGYYIKASNGLYLNSKYDLDAVKAYTDSVDVYLSETPELWTVDGNKLAGAGSNYKQLSYQTNNGKASVFTLRSSGMTFSIFVEDKNGTGTKSALYVPTVGGGVSVSRETISIEGETFAGSEAAPKEGYSFDGWYNLNGDKLSSDSSFVPTEAGVYQARFEENTVSISYAAKIKGESGNASEVSVSLENESIGVITGTAAGSKAVASPGYSFLYWTSDEDGKTVISKNVTYTPKKKNGSYTETTYYAWFEKEIVCVNKAGSKITTPTQGNHSLIINENDCGKYVFTPVDSSWTIYSVAEKKFVSVSGSNELTYSNVSYKWDWNSKGFYTTVKVKVLFFTVNRTYYLTVKNGNLAISTSSASTYLQDDVTSSYTEHLISQYTEITNETHTGVCERCSSGYAVTEPHVFTYTDNGNGTHTKACTCGYSEVIEHTLGTECVKVDQSSHKYVCTACGAEQLEEHALEYTYDDEKHSAVCAGCGYEVSSAAHSFAYNDIDEANHSKACICGKAEMSEHRYISGVACADCGHIDATKARITDVSVAVSKTTTKAKYTIKNWRIVYVPASTTYTAKISATGIGGVGVKNISTSVDNKTFSNGDSYSSNNEIKSLYIRIEDSNGQITNWYYNGSTVAAN